jgi:hypothetical protein
MELNPKFEAYQDKKLIFEWKGIKYYTYTDSLLGFSNRRADIFRSECVLEAETSIHFTKVADLVIQESLDWLANTKISDAERVKMVSTILNSYAYFKSTNKPFEVLWIASFLFFDESEDPEDYDYAYNEKKRLEWSQDFEILKNLYALTSRNLQESRLALQLSSQSLSEVVRQDIKLAEVGAKLSQVTLQRIEQSVTLIDYSKGVHTAAAFIKHLAETQANMLRLTR